MLITHFGHACVLVETAATRLLIDPGTLASGFEQIRQLAGVLVTHQHADHLDLGRLPAVIANNPQAAVYVDEGSAAPVTELGLTPIVVAVDDRVEIGGAVVDIVGGRHAVVHARIPGVPNVGFVIDDGAFYHPGDCLFAPEHTIDVLGVPTSGPWLKLGEAIDFVTAVAPRVAVPIHEAALANTHTQHGYLGRLVPSATTFLEPRRGEAVEV